MTKLYLLSKTIHRLTMYLTVLLTLFMATTGLLLKYSLPLLDPFIKIEFVRYMHNNVSVSFTIVLLLMMISGIYMYLFPILLKHQKKVKTCETLLLDILQTE